MSRGGFLTGAVGGVVGPPTFVFSLAALLFPLLILKLEVCNRPVPRTDSREELRGTRPSRAISYNVVGKLTSYRMA